MGGIMFYYSKGLNSSLLSFFNIDNWFVKSSSDIVPSRHVIIILEFIYFSWNSKTVFIKFFLISTPKSIGESGNSSYPSMRKRIFFFSGLSIFFNSSSIFFFKVPLFYYLLFTHSLKITQTIPSTFHFSDYTYSSLCNLLRCLINCTKNKLFPPPLYPINPMTLSDSEFLSLPFSISSYNVTKKNYWIE